MNLEQNLKMGEIYAAGLAKVKCADNHGMSEKEAAEEIMRKIRQHQAGFYWSEIKDVENKNLPLNEGPMVTIYPDGTQQSSPGIVTDWDIRNQIYKIQSVNDRACMLSVKNLEDLAGLHRSHSLERGGRKLKMSSYWYLDIYPSLERTEAGCRVINHTYAELQALKENCIPVLLYVEYDAEENKVSDEDNCYGMLFDTWLLLKLSGEESAWYRAYDYKALRVLYKNDVDLHGI